MTPRFEVSGELMADPQSTVIGAEAMTGAAVVARVPFDPEVPDGEAGELVVFLTAHGSAAEVLASFRQGDVVRVSGRMRLVQTQAGDGTRGPGLGCLADAVEVASPRRCDSVRVSGRRRIRESTAEKHAYENATGRAAEQVRECEPPCPAVSGIFSENSREASRARRHVGFTNDEAEAATPAPSRSALAGAVWFQLRGTVQ